MFYLSMILVYCNNNGTIKVHSLFTTRMAKLNCTCSFTITFQSKHHLETVLNNHLRHLKTIDFKTRVPQKSLTAFLLERFHTIHNIYLCISYNKYCRGWLNLLYTKINIILKFTFFFFFCVIILLTHWSYWSKSKPKSEECITFLKVEEIFSIHLQTRQCHEKTQNTSFQDQ